MMPFGIYSEEPRHPLCRYALLRHHWQYACLGSLGLLFASLALIPQVETPEQTTIALAEKVSESPDYQVINHLDELLASEENLAWLEN